VLSPAPMTRVLHRFPLSHYSEKGRALLDFKKLEFRIEEHRLGWPQLGIVRLSGQRKVPVLEDAGRVIADSTAIGLYLDERYPEHPLLPHDPARRREVLDLEDRVDHIFGSYAPVVWFDWITRERPEEVARFFAVEVAGAGHGKLATALTRPGMRLGFARRIVEKSERRTRSFIKELCERLGRHAHLTGDEPTFADVAAASLSFHLEFPKSRHLALPELAGVGVPGWADAEDLRPFFEWRRRLYREHLG
jgi:glutathione S-transferase